MAKAKAKSGKPKGGGLGQRLHLDRYPDSMPMDMARSIQEIYERLYALEDKTVTVGGAHSVPKDFAEARALCERFLSPALVSTIRARYG